MKHKCKHKETQKILEALENLQDVLPEVGDIFEDLGIFIDDIAEMYFCEDLQKFYIEKRDTTKVLKQIKRKLMNATFKNFGVKRIGYVEETKPEQKNETKKTTKKEVKPEGKTEKKKETKPKKKQA